MKVLLLAVCSLTPSGSQEVDDLPAWRLGVDLYLRGPNSLRLCDTERVARQHAC
jgi:hypothetical protein